MTDGGLHVSLKIWFLNENFIKKTMTNDPNNKLK